MWLKNTHFPYGLDNNKEIMRKNTTWAANYMGRSFSIQGKYLLYFNLKSTSWHLRSSACQTRAVTPNFPVGISDFNGHIVVSSQEGMKNLVQDCFTSVSKIFLKHQHRVGAEIMSGPDSWKKSLLSLSPLSLSLFLSLHIPSSFSLKSFCYKFNFVDPG